MVAVSAPSLSVRCSTARGNSGPAGWCGISVSNCNSERLVAWPVRAGEGRENVKAPAAVDEADEEGERREAVAVGVGMEGRGALSGLVSACEPARLGSSDNRLPCGATVEPTFLSHGSER